ncbi:hypothetical protein [Cyclobacterium xiamenense]|uniref:hypothetical protein n=1 Tax=Cyclobacterium xiamenense TaxID=1297121 RepID=UPI0012B9680B|nr:hypothetical protein [Cyclobacterium xiamenense]
MDEFNLETKDLLAIAVTVIIAIIGGLAYLITRLINHRITTLKEVHLLDKEKQRKELESNFEEEKQNLRNELNANNLELSHKYRDKNINPNVSDKPIKIIQENKTVYVKYLHIYDNGVEPVYSKRLIHNNSEIEVFSEFQYFRFNRFNSPDNSITIRDRSSGAVDPNILFPWRNLIFTDEGSKDSDGQVDQEISGSDTYFTVTTYYNGFHAKDPSIAMKMERDTLSARLIADFSSIAHFKSIVLNNPKVYRRNEHGQKEIYGLEYLDDGIYHIHATHLKKGEVVKMVFPISEEFKKTAANNGYKT